MLMERKLATVLFVDLVGSTALVSTTDPEVVRRRVTRFFDQVSHCIESHGGTVEKFAGDAVMAAFGVPQAHEDDPERGVRAALAILEAVQELGVEVRMGVEAGEVVTDDAEISSFATGEAVNLAARLQQAAKPGEILIGPGVHRQTVGRIVAEPFGPQTLRGFAQDVEAWRLVAVADETGRELSVAAPFVGREAELELLENTFARAVRDRRAHVFTIYGEPGVGKSRLAREFEAGVEGATILVGRCLPYGESITYWPLAEMVKAAAGISDDDPAAEAVEKLRDCCGDDAVADLLGLASGVLEAVTGDRSAQEIAWAAQVWAGELAGAQPLILGFEDIHWAEEPLLDLIEQLADHIRDVPVLILCLARPELLEVRPGWGGGHVRSTAIELEPLGRQESEELLDALLADADLAPDVRDALLAKTEGNPLFVEETIRMLVEQGGDGKAVMRIPDTVQALIAARIDRLPPAAKAVLQRGAVIGRTFWGGAVRILGGGDDVDTAIEQLLAREFLTREPRSTISGETAYRFRHVLMRDVAYAGLSKGARASLHRRFADWLHGRSPDELLETRAYHLEQAASLHEELDGVVPHELAHEAARALERAGRRALSREANRPARRLLRRAVELEPTLQRRYFAARAAWRLVDLPIVSDEMTKVAELARAEGDAATEGRALTALAEVALLRDADLPRCRELVEQALVLLGEDDSADRFEALERRAQIGWWLGDIEDDERYLCKAREVARAIGRKDLEASAIDQLAGVHLARLEIDRGAELAGEAFELATESGNIVAQAWALYTRGRVERLRGELDDAAASYGSARELFAQAGNAWGLARALNYLAWTAISQGELKDAERSFREAIRILKPLEDRATLCESQRGLAQLLLKLGRLEEAEQVALDGVRTVGPHDITSRATTQMALGLVRAAQGRDEDAEAVFREGLEVLEGTGLRALRLELLEALVGFFRRRGREQEAERYAEEIASLRSAAALA